METVNKTYRSNLTKTLGLTLHLGVLLAGALFGALFHLQDVWAVAIKLLCLAACFVGLQQAPSWQRGLLLAWVWGAGATLTGMGWLYVAMHDVGGMPAIVAGTAMVLFSLLLGIFNGFSGAAWVWFKSRSAQTIGLSFAFAATWTLGEWLRTWVLTGLPWMSVGYGFLDTPLAGLASGLGVLGVGAAAVLLAIFTAQLLNQQRIKGIFAGAVLVALCYGAGQTAYTAPFGAPLSVALLQGNVPQDLKFDPVAKLNYMRRYATMGAASKAQLTVMPETALPTLLTTLPDDVMQSLKSTSGVQLIGIAGELNGQYTNRMAMPFASGSASQWVYDKSHLVPFGEAIPTGFQWFVDLMNMPLSSMGRGGEAQSNLTIDNVQLAVNICYEELFAHEWRSRAASAQVLLNASNFGWYGDSTALPQHANIARMRAIEFQKPYLSATNNGMTLAVLPTGAVQAVLPKNTQDTLTVSVQGMTGQTPYSRWGDWGVVGLAGLVLLGFLLRGAKRSR